MTTARQIRPNRHLLLAALVLAPALLIGGCSSRDTVLAEKVAAADAAATRAEKAADRAEQAANKANKPAAVQVDADPDDIADPGPDQDQQNGSTPTDHGLR